MQIHYVRCDVDNYTWHTNFASSCFLIIMYSSNFYFIHNKNINENIYENYLKLYIYIRVCEYVCVCE